MGGSLNANVHVHALLFDGVYTRATPTARPIFHRLPPPTDAGIAALLTRLHRRIQRLLARRGRDDHRAALGPPGGLQPARGRGGGGAVSWSGCVAIFCARRCRCRILEAVTEPHAVRRPLVALVLAAQPPPAPVGPAA